MYVIFQLLQVARALARQLLGTGTRCIYISDELKIQKDIKYPKHFHF